MFKLFPCPTVDKVMLKNRIVGGISLIEWDREKKRHLFHIRCRTNVFPICRFRRNVEGIFLVLLFFFIPLPCAKSMLLNDSNVALDRKKIVLSHQHHIKLWKYLAFLSWWGKKYNDEAFSHNKNANRTDGGSTTVDKIKTRIESIIRTKSKW